MQQMQLKKQEAAEAARDTSGSRSHRKYKFISQVNSEVGANAVASCPNPALCGQTSVRKLWRAHSTCAHQFARVPGLKTYVVAQGFIEGKYVPVSSDYKVRLSLC